jgi:DNA-binding HxlR family transcriptional regulator
VVRAGSRALSFFAHPLNARILRAHVEGPLRPGELDETIGWAAQSSLRVAVSKMCDLGALTRVELNDPAMSVLTELTAAGRELLPVASALERWLQTAPEGSVELDDPAAHGIVKVLVASWDSTMVRALAERPLTLTELNDRIPYLTYPALKRRLAKLRSTGLVTTSGSGKTTAHVATDWLRHAVMPLSIGGRWELLHDPEAEPIGEVEVEAAFLLTLPLVEAPSKRLSGTCTLAVLVSEGDPGSEPEVAGVAVEVERGTIVSYDPHGASTAPATWALGTAEAWLEALIDGRADGLRTGGAKPRLAKGVVDGLRETLFVP